MSFELTTAVDDTSYCALCDEYFMSLQKRREHVSESVKHPECQVCGRRFLNGDILRKHYMTSRKHHYCVPCDKAFRTAGGFRVHLECSPMHRCESDSEPEEEFGENLGYGWEDLRGEDEFPDEVSDVESEYEEPKTPADIRASLAWEDCDDCDFEDREDLADPPLQFGEDSDADDEDDEDGFTCPTCRTTPRRIGCTPCGHMFCVSCLKDAYRLKSACPACDTEGTIENIRRIYMSSY